MQLPRYLRLVRFPNLLIVAFTQYLIQYLLLVPSFRSAGLSPTLPGFQFALFVFTTMLIAAGGYVINDLVDYEIDLKNKPGKIVINRFIPSQKAIWLYWAIFLTGSSISLYLAFYVGKPLLALIYPSAYALLWLYSHFLKKLPVWGNLVVALFCAFVPGVVLFAERESYSQLPAGLANRVWLLIGGYVLFAFSSTMLREIVKDIEDMYGDEKSNCRTLPIAFGVRTAKIWAGIFAAMLLALMCALLLFLWQNAGYLAFAFAVTAVVFPLLFCIGLLKKAAEKQHYSRLSKWAKAIMVTGLLLLILIWKS